MTDTIPDTSWEILDAERVLVLRADNTWEPLSFKDLKVGDKFKALQTMSVDELPVGIDPKWDLDGADFVYTATDKQD